MRKQLLLGLLGFLFSFVAMGLVLPGTWQVQREQMIRVSQESLSAEVADLSSWQRWSQWRAELDPSIQLELGELQRGVGATQRWAGKTVGQGSLRITEADPRGGLRFDLERGALASRAQLLFEEAGNETRAVWREEGDLGRGPLAGWRALVMDGLLGPQLESQLVELARYAEQAR